MPNLEDTHPSKKAQSKDARAVWLVTKYPGFREITWKAESYYDNKSTINSKTL